MKAFALAGAAVGAAAALAFSAGRHAVAIDGTSYQPAKIVVHRGDTVVWTNKDPFPHTVTAKGAFDSGSIAAGATWKYVARKAGTYDYICTFHPNMKGTVEVR